MKTLQGTTRVNKRAYDVNRFGVQAPNVCIH